MRNLESQIWDWGQWKISWSFASDYENTQISTLLIHGFGACKEHWRHNQKILGKYSKCYAIDLMGFGQSSQPISQLKDELPQLNSFIYSFDEWAKQVADFCEKIIKGPVILIGNSIGGVVALRACQIMGQQCSGVVLIDCAQRRMDDKRLHEQNYISQAIRPLLKNLVSKRILSRNLFRNVAKEYVIKKILKQAYPSGNNIDQELIDILLNPSKRDYADEAFRGFINLFNDHLAPNLMETVKIPIDLIWGEKDPWEQLEEARFWKSKLQCIRSLHIIEGAGHCPHDEDPNSVNPILLKIIQAAI